MPLDSEHGEKASEFEIEDEVGIYTVCDEDFINKGSLELTRRLCEQGNPIIEFESNTEIKELIVLVPYQSGQEFDYSYDVYYLPIYVKTGNEDLAKMTVAYNAYGWGSYHNYR